ncbi:MAG: aspartate kinase [Planctomycetota bacterium]|jgi:aspartate kinase
MRVLKFGGTSVGSAENLARVREIVHGQLEAGPVVVVSAHSGVTNELLKQARSAARGRYSLRWLRRRHADLYRSIEVDPDLVEPLLEELGDLLRGLKLIRELTARSLDLVASFGERMSARGIAAYLAAAGMKAQGVDAYDLGLKSDSRFTAANPDPRCFPQVRRALNALRKKGGIPVVTGFVAKDAHGNITTLGRSGSDLTATLVAAAGRADQVQIWTDVDGVMTADPRVVKSARAIPVLSIAEASELAYYGAKVIHPATMLPAVENRIPVSVRKTSSPELEGTLILAEAPQTRGAVKSIAYKRGIILLTISSSRMLMQSGFMARIFEIFAHYDLSVDLVATSEVTVSVTVDSERHLDAVLKDLGEFAEVTVEREMAQVCVVGEGIRERVGVAAEVLGTLKKARLPVRLISHGGTKINISFLLEAALVDRAVRSLHRTFFE